MEGVEHRRKDELYKMWYKFMQLQREKALENRQNHIVEDIADKQVIIGTISDQTEVQNQHNKYLTDKYRVTC